MHIKFLSSKKIHILHYLTICGGKLYVQSDVSIVFDVNFYLHIFVSNPVNREKNHVSSFRQTWRKEATDCGFNSDLQFIDNRKKST
jgi:hypothetical protein